MRYTSHLYLGNHAQAARYLHDLRPRAPREKKAPSVVLAHLRRQLSLEQEREALRRARTILAQARAQKSGAALSRLLVDKESLRIALRSESADEAEALLGLVAEPDTTGRSAAMSAQGRPALVHTASEELEVLLLRGRTKDAYERARAFESAARGDPNVLLRCEARVLLAECAFLESEPGHARALASDARAFADARGFRPLALRARLVEALGLAWEAPSEGGCALALLAHELQALRLPLSHARVRLLRARLGVCEGPETEIVAAWTTLASEGASCIRADQVIARFATACDIHPRGFRLASFADGSLLPDTSDADALRRLSSTRARVVPRRSCHSRNRTRRRHYTPGVPLRVPRGRVSIVAARCWRSRTHARRLGRRAERGTQSLEARRRPGRARVLVEVFLGRTRI